MNEIVKNEFIQILKMEIKKSNDLSLKNHLINEINRVHHTTLNRLCISMNIKTPPMNKVEICVYSSKKEMHQNLINVNKKYQLVLLKNFKYNNNISDETKNYLDVKIGSIYKKIGKLIRKDKQRKERILNKFNK